MSDSTTTVDEPEPATTTSPSTLRKVVLLIIFCGAMFLDAFNGSALVGGIGSMTSDLGLTATDAVWVIVAYQISLASLLLCSGRVSDLYNPKFVFVGGAFAVGALSLGTGFTRSKVAFFALRALTGIPVAMTIPSALALIVRLFPEPGEQGKAIAAFSGSAAVGNILGLVLGAVLSQNAGWEWVLWFTALLAIPIAIVAALVVPSQPPSKTITGSKLANLDLPGVAIITASLVLLIFAFTATGTDQWSSATVLAPLIISVFGIAAFFVWEARIPAERAAFPPKIWFYPNFAILFAVALSVFLWYTSAFLISITYWEQVYHWSTINAVVHLLPVGIVGGATLVIGGPLTANFERKYVLLAGQLIAMVGTVLLTFADTPSTYWRFVFPGFIIGTIGVSLLFVNTNVAIFAHTPNNIAGTVGAIFNSALQLGSAVGIAIATSIQIAVDNKNARKEGANSYAGRTAAYWFVFAVIGAETLAVVALYRTSHQLQKPVDEEKDEKVSADLEKDVEATN